MMKRYYILLIISSLALWGSVVFESDINFRGGVFNSNIITHPYKAEKWQENINILINEDGSFHATLILEGNELPRTEVFSVFGQLNKDAEYAYQIVSKTKSMQETSLPELISEPYTQLYFSEDLTLVDSFNVIYRDNDKLIVEAKEGKLKTLMITRE